MINLPRNKLVFLVQNHIEIMMVAVFSLGVMLIVQKALRRLTSEKSVIPGRLGLPLLGETFSFLSATGSTKGCYDFVRLRRLWHGKWFKTRIFGKVHVFVPTTDGAKTIFANDLVLFNKGYVKSMADVVGKKSLLCVPQESHKRIRRLLSDPFSMNSLSKFVMEFDNMLYQRLNKLEEGGKSFVVFDFCMKIAFDAICNRLISVTEAPLLQEIERDCTYVSNAMLSFPLMIPGTRYYKGIKVKLSFSFLILLLLKQARKRLMETFGEMISSRRSGKEYSDDFLQSMLQRDSYPPSEKLEDSEIMDNLLTLIVAGQTTTAAAMMWSVKFLDENEEVQDRLREEQLSIIRNKAEGASLTLEDLNSMCYGLKVRKTKPAGNLVYISGVLWDIRFEIKKGWHLNIDATYIHFDHSLYKDPMRFNPSRFDVEVPKPYSFMPFGSGPRTCLGINMAKMTMWRVDDRDPCLEKKAHIPRLRSGCPITLRTLKKRDII
ncbi:Abscisic acid 8'-hydroxylase 3 [Vitis vinifera]|uniref:Abscisic acid 8'-hydroxylase 3 n=1 Tax=Vitis vinifera TaxID=29760 RepID=A0A438K5F4_VITVI|nr:Abscisic acid 8'-hydroxylase 3 [Vitis vinifera]